MLTCKTREKRSMLLPQLHGLPETAQHMYRYLKDVSIAEYGANPDEFNGSFYLKDKFLISALRRTQRTLVRTRKTLRSAGLIEYISGDGRGNETVYRVLPETNFEKTEERKGMKT